MFKRLIVVTVLLALLVTACAKPTPTAAPMTEVPTEAATEAPD